MLTMTNGERVGNQAAEFLKGFMDGASVKFQAVDDEVTIVLGLHIDDETYVARTTLSAYAATSSIYEVCRSLSAHIYANYAAVGCMKALLS